MSAFTRATPQPSAPPTSTKELRRLSVAYWRCFASFTGRRLWLAVALLIFIGVLEGSGLLMLVPLLHTLGLGNPDQLGGFAGQILSTVRKFNLTSALPSVLAIFVVIKAAQALLRAWSHLLNLEIEIDFVCFLRERFYGALMRANWLFVARQRSSDFTQSLLVELPMVGVGTRQFLTLLSLVFVALVQVLIALSLSLEMTGLALASGVVVGLGLRSLRRRTFALGQMGLGRRSEMAAAVNEHLAGMKIAKSHGRETQHFDHFRAAMNAIARHTLRVERIGALTNIWVEVGAVVALSFFVWLSVNVRHVDTAQLLVLVFVFTRLLSHLTRLQSLWQQIFQSLPSFDATEKAHALLAAAAEPRLPAVVEPLVLRDAIRIDGVSFRYDPALPTEALRRIDLLIPARQVTALCGASGAGKSTLADLVLSLLPPTSGRMEFDGAELTGDRLHRWRRSIGYVSQETFLFHDTVRANLLWAQPGASEADLRAALRSAAAEQFVDRLPDGLDTLVGDRGVRLSGGERQRLALARALLCQPTLLVLDEATSALDVHNERLVQDAIERLHGELTIVLIAHRLSTVRMADRIVVMDAGRVAETGTWEELSGRENGVFRGMLAADRRG